MITWTMVSAVSNLFRLYMGLFYSQPCSAVLVGKLSEAALSEYYLYAEPCTRDPSLAMNAQTTSIAVAQAGAYLVRKRSVVCSFRLPENSSRSSFWSAVRLGIQSLVESYASCFRLSLDLQPSAAGASVRI